MRIQKAQFLRTGNSCRFQMAEILGDGRLSGERDAFRVYIQADSYANPNAILPLAEIGVQLVGEPKPADGFRVEYFDLVVTDLGDASEKRSVAIPKLWAQVGSLIIQEVSYV